MSTSRSPPPGSQHGLRASRRCGPSIVASTSARYGWPADISVLSVVPVAVEGRAHRGIREEQRAVGREERDRVLEVLDDRFERRTLAGELRAVGGQPRA